MDGMRKFYKTYLMSEIGDSFSIFQFSPRTEKTLDFGCLKVKVIFQCKVVIEGLNGNLNVKIGDFGKNMEFAAFTESLKFLMTCV